MTVARTFTVICEVDDCVGIGGRSKYHVITVSTTAAALAGARGQGWRHVAGRDICPACWQAGWRYRGSQHLGEFRQRSR